MKKNILLLVVLFYIAHNSINGQTKAQIQHLKKIYKGTWFNKKDKRYLKFFFDPGVNYITVNDWSGSPDMTKSNTLDAYKAFIKDEKLILPQENKEHHSPYCEIEIADSKLIYQCNSSLNFKDSVLVKNQADTIVFRRMRE